MIHDILFALFATNSDLKIENFAIPEIASNFLHPSEIKILEDIIRISNHYKEIRKFITFYSAHSISYFQQKKVEALHKGLYLQAFADGLDVATNPYRDLIVNLEERYLKRPNLSLIFIFHEINRFQPLFQSLLALISGVVTQKLHGCSILQYLHQNSLHGNELISSAIRKIEKSVYSIFIKQLYSWLLYGRFVDQYKEFFIQHVEHVRNASTSSEKQATTAMTSLTSFSDNQSLNSELWQYEICYEMLPHYFPLSWAEKVLFIGQTVLMFNMEPKESIKQKKRESSYEKNLLLGKDSVWGSQEYDFFKKFNDLQNDYEINVGKIEFIVDEIKLKITEHMSEIVVKEANLIGQLRTIKDFFLLGRGELFLEFLKLIKQEKIFFSKGITEATTRDINRIFQMAANNVNVTNEADHFQLVLPAKDDLDSFSYETKGLISLISLKHKVKWPLHLLFSPKVLEKYNDLFRFLLRIKKIQYDLQLIWCHQRMNKVGKYSQLLQFRNKSMFLIDNLQYYLQVDVLESQYSILLSSIQETTDFERIERAHSVFQANVMSLCFLITPNSVDASKSTVINLNENPVLRILDKILLIVDKFCGFCMTCNDPMTKMELQEFKSYDISFSNHVDECIKLLIGLKAGPSSAPLSQFLLRLDYNYWFSTNLSQNK